MSYGTPPDPNILVHGNPTERERVQVEAWIDLGSSRQAAKKLGINQATISRAAQRVKKRAERAGYSQNFDATAHVPSTEQVKGRSVYTKDDQGNPIWLKTEKSLEEQKLALKEYIDGLISGIEPQEPTKKPRVAGIEDDLLAAVFVGDAHFGMYASKAQTRHSNYDSDIASEAMRDAIENLVDRSPNAAVGLLVDVGDYMHTNSSHGNTWAGTSMDVDTRFSRVLRVAGQAMYHAVNKMLSKFPKVVVAIAQGNHNKDMAPCIQEMVTAYFRLEPRVTVLETKSAFHYIEWGKWLIGVNHGDKIKPEQLVSAMARDMPEAWGRTDYRMWALGHFHHQDVKEIGGCVVQKFAALPPPDAWHSSSGYGSGQAMQMIVFKKSGGRHSTLIYEVPRPSAEPDVVID